MTDDLPLVLLEGRDILDTTSSHSSTHWSSNHSDGSADGNVLKKRIMQIGGDLDDDHHEFMVYDQEGAAQSSVTQAQKDNYRFYKGAVLTLEFIIFLFFFVGGIGAFGLIIAEIQIGSGWLITLNGMIGITVCFGVVGGILIGLYVWYSVKFMTHGDEQFDELLANTLAFGTIYIVTLGLLCKYFSLDDVNNSVDDLNTRRVLYVVIAVYGVEGMWIIIRGISRHLTITKVVTINHQKWLYNRSFGNSAPEGEKDKKFIQEHYAKPSKRVWFFTAVMWFTSAIVLIFTIWILSEFIAISQVPNFGPMYISLFVCWGLAYVLLVVTWAIWSFSSSIFKASFTAHFDVFFGTHAIYMASVMFMFIGYRFNYWSVSDELFETPGVTVPALKIAYFTKIAILMFSLLPVLAMGIAKGTCLMINEWPVRDVAAYNNEITKAKKSRN